VYAQAACINIFSNQVVLFSAALHCTGTASALTVQPRTTLLYMLQDYKGQELAERLYYYIIIILGAISWVWGYYVQDFMIVVYGCGAGVVISLLVSTSLICFSIVISIHVDDKSIGLCLHNQQKRMLFELQVLVQRSATAKHETRTESFLAQAPQYNARVSTTISQHLRHCEHYRTTTSTYIV
jgi:Microsomal signal peptidase 12 kDa subunit (SPC12)